ncbi:MAG: aldehyde ferredoxin oxidoreductase family protein [Deltaproteobacteria bacterium]|nr:aldehyde ferredoxin oxidoreductase family protein [Deltaproteobacteria bacterium]
MFGWTGKILRVDLSEEKIITENLDPKIAKDFIGGRGIGIYYLLKEMEPKCDPLSRENMLIMATGPLTGTMAPTGSRYMITTKSPLTGAVTCSNSGGDFPTELKKSGFDGIIIKGKADKPVYLYIKDGNAELKDASDLWGMDTHKTTDKVLEKTNPKAKVACIGPAGEKLVRFASVMNDKNRAAGRSGVGAVMGSKKLKAIAVYGSNKVNLANAEEFKKFNSEILKKFKQSIKETPLGIRINGTAGVVMATNSFGILPTKNWQYGTFDNWKDIDGRTLTEKYLVKNKSCFACPVGCGRLTKVEVPGFEGEGEGPEYETLYAMGSNCMVKNLAAIVKANYTANELGLDTITMGATIACAMEMAEKGYISEKEIGMKLEWGDDKALVELTEKTGLREGFGDMLAEGSFRLASKYGHPELSMVSKKQEFPGYEPRGAQGMGLAYATSSIGASHMKGDTAYFEIFGIPKAVDPIEWRGKSKLVKIWQDLFGIIDSAGLCVFFAIRNLVEQQIEVPPEAIRRYLNAATGADYTLEELIKAGERIIVAERMFLVKNGFTRKDDSLPKRLTATPMPEGPVKGNICHLDEMLDEYYKERGWTQDGIPEDSKLEELGLMWTK